MSRSSPARPWLWICLGSLLLVASCGGAQKEKEGAPDDQVEESWTGYRSKRFPANLDTATTAAKTATQKLNLRMQEETAGFMERTLSVGSEEMSAVIQVNEITKESTRVSVKIGWFGDADASRRILSEVEAEINNLNKRRIFPTGFGGIPPPPPPQ